MKKYFRILSAFFVGGGLCLGALPVANAQDSSQDYPAVYTNFLNGSETSIALFGTQDASRMPALQPGGKATGKVVPGLEQYYSQRLIGEFECNQAIVQPMTRSVLPGHTSKCGWVLAPVDYAHPESGNTAILVNRISKNDGKKRPLLFVERGSFFGRLADSALILSAVYDDPYESPSFGVDKLLEKYDLVAFGMRGEEGTAPEVRCSVDEFAHGSPYPTDPEEIRNRQHVENSAKYRSCVTSISGKFGYNDADAIRFLNNMGSEQIAKDMDIIRSVMGAEKLSFFGNNDANRIGVAYLNNFSDNTEKVSFDFYRDFYDLGGNLTDAMQLEELADVQVPVNSQIQRFFDYCKVAESEGKTYEVYNADGTSQQLPFKCFLNHPSVQPHEGDLADDTPGLTLETKQFQNFARRFLANPLDLLYKEEDGSYQPAGTLDFESIIWALEDLETTSWNVEREALDLFAKYYELVSRTEYDEEFRATIRIEYTNFGRGVTYDARVCADYAKPAEYSEANALLRMQKFWKNIPAVDPGAPYNQAAGKHFCDFWTAPGSYVPLKAEVKNPNVLIIGYPENYYVPIEAADKLASSLGGALVTFAKNGSYGFSEAHTKVLNDFYINGVVPKESTVDYKVVSYQPEKSVEEIAKPEKSVEEIAKPEISADKAESSVGGEVTVTVKNVTPNGKVAFHLHSDPVYLGTVEATAAGVATLTFKVPANVPAGSHKVVATDLTTKQLLEILLEVKANATLVTPGKTEGKQNVTPKNPVKPSATEPAKDVKVSTKQLAKTGANSAGMLLVSASLMLVGGLVLFARRRY